MTETPLSPSAPFDSLVAFLRERILNRTKIPEAELGNDVPLADLGMTSLDAVLISGELEDHFDIEVDPAVMFEHKTIHSIAGHLAGSLPQA